MTDIQNETEDKAQAVNSKVESVAEINYAATLAEMPCNPAIENKLGQQYFQDGLIEYIKHANTPFNIALEGEWGSGKTSLMNAISYKLCGFSIIDNKVVTNNINAPFYGIWINTWHFTISTVSSQAVIAILQSIVNQMGQLLPEEKSNAHITNFKKILAGVAVGGSKMLFKIADRASCGVLSDLGVDSEDVGDMVKGVQDSFSDQDNKSKDNKDSVVQAFSVIDRLKVEIRELINEILVANYRVGSNTTWNVELCSSCDGADCEYKASLKKGFIFFIDDLDRLEPALAVDILEALNNIFDLKYCVFVFAVDHKTVVKGLRLKLAERNGEGDNDKNSERERECERFFDKIFQLSVSVPVKYYDIKPLLKSSLEAVSYFYDSELNDADLELFQKIVVLSIGESLGNNPRYLKKCINALSLIDALTQSVWRSLGRDVNKPGQMESFVKKSCFILFFIKIAYGDIYQLIVEHPNFKTWDHSFANQHNAPAMDDALSAEFQKVEKCLHDQYHINLRDPINFDYEWVEAIFRISQPSYYLRERFMNTVAVLKELDNIFMIGLLDSIRDSGDYNNKKIVINDEYESTISKVVLFFNIAATHVNVSLI